MQATKWIFFKYLYTSQDKDSGAQCSRCKPLSEVIIFNTSNWFLPLERNLFLNLFGNTHFASIMHETKLRLSAWFLLKNQFFEIEENIWPSSLGITVSTISHWSINVIICSYFDDNIAQLRQCLTLWDRMEFNTQDIDQW